MVPNTARDLVEELRRSQLIDAAQCEAAQAEAVQHGDARSLAARLIDLNILTRFQAGQALEGFAHELVLGAYRLVEEIGEGGMGHVFKAWQPRLKRVVALKMLRQDLLARQPGAIRRFAYEAQAIAKLNSPNVVILYDADEINGVHFLAMEYVEGIDLSKLVQEQGPLAFPTACDYIRQAAIGLQHAHEAGLVHRDIKPSNLLVTRAGPVRHSSILRRRPLVDTPLPAQANRSQNNSGVVKILDMGLVRLTGSLDDNKTHTTLTQEGSVIGTPDFIAPEQARDATNVDIRADLYSLGCTFYYLLTGRPPFPDGSPVEKLLKHYQDEPRRVEYLRQGTPGPILSVLYRLMQKKPDDRYQTPQEVVDALAQVQAALFGNSAGPGTSQRWNDLIGDVPNQVTAVGDPDVILPRSVQQEAVPTQNLSAESLVIPATRKLQVKGHTGYVTGVTFSPDGKRLITGGLDGKLFVWNLTGDRPMEEASILGKLGEVQFVVVSPVENCIFTGSSALNGHMWRWEWTERNPGRWLSRIPGEPIREDALCISRTGNLLAAGVGPDVLLWTINQRDITRTSVLKGHSGIVKALAFAPDGKRLFSAGEDSKILLWEFGWFRTSQKATLAGHTDVISSLAISPNGMLLASGGNDHTIRLWDAVGNDPDPRAVLKGHSRQVRLVQFQPSGTRLLSVSEGGQAILWDVATQSKVREWAFDKGLAASIALSPDGRLLAVGANEGLVHLFDLEQTFVEELAPTAALFATLA